MTAVPPARVLDCSPESYHRLPGFSSSLAKVLISKSPVHAKDVYDRQREGDDLDAELTEDQRKLRDRGTVLHAMVLGKGKRIAPLPRDLFGKNWAWTDRARAAQALARQNGLVPVKENKIEMYERTATAICARIKDAGHDLDGTSELAIEWHEPTPWGPVLCRGMLDHVVMWGAHGDPITDDFGTSPGAIIYDLKTPEDAEPERSTRTAESLGYAMQAAAYTRALAALYPRLAGRIEFRFLICEAKRPYALWDPTPDGMFRELGEQRWLRAVHAWGRGIATGEWPGYRTPERTEITAPMWALKQEGFTADE